jgi:hypothetical protein
VTPYQNARLLLAEGRFTEAWPLFESRRRYAAPPIFLPQASYPEWMGEDPDGLVLMVVAEQGWGDQLMFGRYLPLLQRRGARITVACHPVIAPVFSAIGVAATHLYTDAPLPQADRWVLIGSLPLRLGVPLPPPPRYLDIPLGSGGGVGVMARGSSALANDANRSLDGADAEQLLSLGRDLSPEATGAASFLETARILADLDLVITVDTAVAHLAGAMGKPCWVLLPQIGLDWRWGVSGTYSRWYPSMKLYRQRTPGDWRSVLAQVARDVAAIAP